MNKHFRILNTLLVLGLFFGIQTAGFSQPPPPTQGHGLTGDSPPGGGAPVGDGMYILIGLAGLYAGKKIFDHRKLAQDKVL